MKNERGTVQGSVKTPPMDCMSHRGGGGGGAMGLGGRSVALLLKPSVGRPEDRSTGASTDESARGMGGACPPGKRVPVQGPTSNRVGEGRGGEGDVLGPGGVVVVQELGRGGGGGHAQPRTCARAIAAVKRGTFARRRALF